MYCRLYFRPKKIVSTGYLTINESQTISRTSLDTININSKTYTKTFKIDEILKALCKESLLPNSKEQS